MVFLVGLAVIIALTVGVGSQASAQNRPAQNVFILGATNTVNAMSSLVGSVADSAMLLVDNNGGGPALDLQVEPGQAPMKVNSGAKVANLNADTLDGKDASEFRSATGVYEVGKQLNGAANEVTVGIVECDAGDEILAGGYIGLSSGARVVGNLPQLDGSWVVLLESGSSAGTTDVYAQCYDFPPAHDNTRPEDP